MKNIKRTATRFGFIAAMLFALVATVMPVAAVNLPITATGNLTGVVTGSTSGALAFTATLNGTTQTVTPATDTVALSATDSTNGTGFHILLAATSFASLVAPADVLGAFSFTGGTAIGGGSIGTSSVLSATAITVSVVAQANETSNATQNGISPAFSLVIPGTAIAHNDYTSILTVAYATGP